MCDLIGSSSFNRLEYREELRCRDLRNRTGADLRKRKLPKPLLPLDEGLLRHPIPLHVEVLARQRLERILNRRFLGFAMRSDQCLQPSAAARPGTAPVPAERDVRVNAKREPLLHAIDAALQRPSARAVSVRPLDKPAAVKKRPRFLSSFAFQTDPQ
jgi:hypothetical protein